MNDYLIFTVQKKISYLSWGLIFKIAKYEYDFGTEYINQFHGNIGKKSEFKLSQNHQMLSQKYNKNFLTFPNEVQIGSPKLGTKWGSKLTSKCIF